MPTDAQSGGGYKKRPPKRKPAPRPVAPPRRVTIGGGDRTLPSSAQRAPVTDVQSGGGYDTKKADRYLHSKKGQKVLRDTYRASPVDRRRDTIRNLANLGTPSSRAARTVNHARMIEVHRDILRNVRKNLRQNEKRGWTTPGDLGQMPSRLRLPKTDIKSVKRDIARIMNTKAEGFTPATLKAIERLREKGVATDAMPRSVKAEVSRRTEEQTREQLVKYAYEQNKALGGKESLKDWEKQLEGWSAEDISRRLEKALPAAAKRYAEENTLKKNLSRLNVKAGGVGLPIGDALNIVGDVGEAVFKAGGALSSAIPEAAGEIGGLIPGAPGEAIRGAGRFAGNAAEDLWDLPAMIVPETYQAMSAIGKAYGGDTGPGEEMLKGLRDETFLGKLLYHGDIKGAAKLGYEHPVWSALEVRGVTKPPALLAQKGAKHGAFGATMRDLASRSRADLRLDPSSVVTPNPQARKRDSRADRGSYSNALDTRLLMIAADALRSRRANKKYDKAKDADIDVEVAEIMGQTQRMQDATERGAKARKSAERWDPNQGRDYARLADPTIRDRLVDLAVGGNELRKRSRREVSAMLAQAREQRAEDVEFMKGIKPDTKVDDILPALIVQRIVRTPDSAKGDLETYLGYLRVNENTVREQGQGLRGKELAAYNKTVDLVDEAIKLIERGKVDLDPLFDAANRYVERRNERDAQLVDARLLNMDRTTAKNIPYALVHGGFRYDPDNDYWTNETGQRVTGDDIQRIAMELEYGKVNTERGDGPLPRPAPDMGSAAPLVDPTPGPNTGYHVGDGGVASDTTLGRMGGGRSTGHFGTGTYFVSGPDALPGDSGTPGSMVDRGAKGIDLTGLNLYRPGSEQAGRSAHAALHEINKMVSGMKSQGREIIAAMLPKNGKSMDEVMKIVDEEVEAARGKWAGAYGKSPKQNPDAALDTAATRVMKRLGWDGIDVRHIPALDNVDYGSVVYRRDADARPKPTGGPPPPPTRPDEPEPTPEPEPERGPAPGEAAYLSHYTPSGPQAQRRGGGILPQGESNNKRTGRAVSLGLYDTSWQAMQDSLMRPGQRLPMARGVLKVLSDARLGSFNGAAPALAFAERLGERNGGSYRVLNLSNIDAALNTGAMRVDGQVMEGDDALEASIHDAAALFESLDTQAPEGRHVVVSEGQWRELETMLIDVPKNLQWSPTARGFIQSFRNTVLRFSLRWTLGNAAEPILFRNRLAGVTPKITANQADKVFRTYMKEFPKGTAEFARLFGMVHGGKHHGQATAQQMVNKKGPVQQIANVPVVGLLVKGTRGVQAQIAKHNEQMEDMFTQALVGRYYELWKKGPGQDVKDTIKRDRQLTGEALGFLREGLELQRQLAEGFALKELTDTNRLNAIKDYLDRAYGRYSDHSPAGRMMLAYGTPFIDWYRNTAFLLFKTLPLNHPIAASTFAMLADIQEEALAESGDVRSKRDRNSKPEYMVGNPAFADGSVLNVSGYLPMGWSLESFKQQFTPYLGFINGAAGKSPFGDDARVSPDFNKEGLFEKFLLTAIYLSESNVPGARQLNTALEGGASSYDNSWFGDVQKRDPDAGSTLEGILRGFTALPTFRPSTSGRGTGQIDDTGADPGTILIDTLKRKRKGSSSGVSGYKSISP